jgi:L-lactate dehydrogenase complex protein LldE
VRVALLATCLVDGLFPDVGKATVGLLERLGHRVEVPPDQTCCGQMHINTGYVREALPLVRRHVAVFEGKEAVVVPSGSCAGSVRHQHAWVAAQAGDRALASAASAVASRTWELSEFLVDVLGVEDVGAYYPHRVTYHPTCHSLRVLRVGDRPLRLLRAVAGIDLVELPDRASCCGFRDRHDRAGRRARAGPARAQPGPRLPPGGGGRRPGGRDRPPGGRPPGPHPPAHLDQRPERHQRHRAQPRRGRPRPPHPEVVVCS